MAETITLYPAAFDEDNSTYRAIASSYPASNVVGKSATNPSGYGVGVGLVTGSGAATSAYFTFDVSDIPSDAEDISVSCKVSIYATANFGTRTSTRYVQLCKGTTAVGSYTSYSPTSTAATYTPEVTSSNSGTWTRSELDNLKVLVYTTRSSSSTTTNVYVYIRGIDLTIEYEEAGIKYTVTITDNGFSVDPTGSAEYTEGTTVPISIYDDTLPKVTLDGTDITSQFIEKQVEVSTSYSGAPTASSYANISSGSSGIASAVGCTAENPASISSNWYGSSSAAVDTCYAQYTFDLSSIPSNATDIVVSCTVCGKAESSTYSHQASGRYSVWQLCCDGEGKSEQIYTTSTSQTTLSFSDTGSWTRAELDSLQLRHFVGYYGGITYGATLSITYAVPGSGSDIYYYYELTVSANHSIVVSASEDEDTGLRVKINGNYKKILKVLQKQNGSYVEISVNDLSAMNNFKYIT